MWHDRDGSRANLEKRSRRDASMHHLWRSTRHDDDNRQQRMNAKQQEEGERNDRDASSDIVESESGDVDVIDVNVTIDESAHAKESVNE